MILTMCKKVSMNLFSTMKPISFAFRMSARYTKIAIITIVTFLTSHTFFTIITMDAPFTNITIFTFYTHFTCPAIIALMTR